MEKEKIKQLLTKYWEAGTTIEEEVLLKHYFANNEADEELAKAWFGSIDDFKAIEAAEVKVRLTDPYFFLKIAATVVLAGSMALLAINANHKRQEEKDFALRKKAEASLYAIAQELNQGYQNLNQAAQLMAKEQFNKQ